MHRSDPLNEKEKKSPISCILFLENDITSSVLYGKTSLCCVIDLLVEGSLYFVIKSHEIYYSLVSFGTFFRIKEGNSY